MPRSIPLTRSDAPASEVTTIKVPRALRDRIKDDAAEHGLSIAARLSELLDQYQRDERLAAVGRAYDSGIDDDYRAELSDWDVTLADGEAS